MKDVELFIKNNLRKEKLEELSTAVIDAYKKGDDFTLKLFASVLKTDSGDGSRKKVFYSLIKMLHPDRLSTLKDEYHTAVESSDDLKLKMLKELLELRVKTREVREDRFSYTYSETWSAEDVDGYYDMDEETEDYDEEEFSFIDAVKGVVYGSHSFILDPADLGQIDGSLNLEGNGISEVEGLEYCRNVRRLNIAFNDISSIFEISGLSQIEELYASNNNITDIEPLSGLELLEIVDLSGNDIEDISPLIGLDRLQFADLRKNPLQNKEHLAELSARGVVVLYS